MFICRRCARQVGAATFSSRAAKDLNLNPAKFGNTGDKGDKSNQHDGVSPIPPTDQGALTRRLEEATEDMLVAGGSSARQTVQDAGFSKELKEKLLKRLADAHLSAEQLSRTQKEASAVRDADAGSRQFWKGGEGAKDAMLRKVDETRKPPSRPVPRMKPKHESPGQRLASARDQVSLYAGTGLKGLSKEERQEMKEQLKDRFRPGAASMPIAVSESGLAAMANRRIDEAIARGQFKKLPRGKSLDTPNKSPYIDTTQFLMNRIIQRQDIVPPWIEKQQELVKATRVFRQRLRNDWRRHMARMVAAEGGSLQEQVNRAQDYAAAERIHNPQQPKTEQPDDTLDDAATGAQSDADKTQDESRTGSELSPFRDSAWVEAERKYLQLSVDNLNRMTRSYNLMAPDVAKKAYFDLQRELAACWAEVAPTVAAEIEQRATLRAKPPTQAASSQASVLDVFRGNRNDVKIYTEPEERAYGFLQWWRDQWRKLSRNQ